MAVVYRHRRLDTFEIFYVGIGKDAKRAYVKTRRNILWNRITQKTKFIVEILIKDIDYEEAKELEILLISEYGRINLKTGPLANLTDGGDGSLGYVPTEETRQKLRNKTLSEEVKKHLSNINKGKIIPRDIVEKIANANRGKKRKSTYKHTDETKLKMSLARKGKEGKKHTDETKKKLSEIQKGKTHTEETKNKMRGRRESMGALVLNTQTGVFYSSITEACESVNMKRSAFRTRLVGKSKDKIDFIYA